MEPFNFDEWMELAKSDPDAFERRRAETIEAFIISAPIEKQHKLRCIQWRADMERQKCKNPMQSCVLMFDKMWDSVYGKAGLLEAILVLSNMDVTPVTNMLKKTTTPPVINPATILPFDKKDNIS